MTLRGRWSLALSPGPTALAVASLVFLGGSVLLLAIGSLREVQEAVARTEWPFGVAAFALGGAATIGLLAVGEHAWPRMLHRAHRGGLLAYAVTWSAFGGAAVAGIALIAAGLFHVGMVADGMTTAEINAALLPDPPRGVGRSRPAPGSPRPATPRGVPPGRPRPSGPCHHTGGRSRRRPGRALIA